MQVVYTHDIFSRQSVGGISRYFVELIRGLSAQGINLRVLAGEYLNQHLYELDGDPCLDGKYRPNAHRQRFRWSLNRWRKQQLAGFRGSEAIVHHTYYSFQRPARSARLVVTIHDMIPERFPDQFGWKAPFLSLAKRRSCDFADRILVNSQTTKSDLVNWHGIDPDKVHVTYLGNSLLPYRGLHQPRPNDRPYLLYVGARKGYKNCQVLFEAFAASPKLRRDFSIVCFGGGPFSRREMRRIHELGIAGLVRQTGGDDGELANYYSHAAAFVCPSIYEGFGMPAVEAMSFACPVVVSDCGSIPEVVGPAGVYFNPHDRGMLTDVLETVLYNESLKQKLRAEMEKRESHFRWEHTAQETLRCYESIAA